MSDKVSILSLLLPFILSMLFGAIIGTEREFTKKQESRDSERFAGIRTSRIP